MTGRPLVLGHRGASAVAPENTVAAFSRARELGADGVELDVRRTLDGVLLVHHDPAIAGVGAIGTITFADIRTAVPAVPTLDEALDALRGLVVNVEVKCLPWEPDADVDGSVMRATLDVISAYVRDANTGMIVVSSFSLAAVDLAREYEPEIATGWLTHGQDVADAARIAADRGHAWLNPDVAAALAAGTEGIRAAHASGVLVSAWTVDDPDAARALAAAGVNILISNAPDVILAAVA